MLPPGLWHLWCSPLRTQQAELPTNEEDLRNMHPEQLGAIGEQMRSQGRWPEAEKCFFQALENAERMNDIIQHVPGSSQEQARGSKQITQAIENISEMVHHLNRAQKEQARGSEQVMKAVERIKEVAEHHSDSMGNMKKIVDLKMGKIRRRVRESYRAELTYEPALVQHIVDLAALPGAVL